MASREERREAIEHFTTALTSSLSEFSENLRQSGAVTAAQRVANFNVATSGILAALARSLDQDDETEAAYRALQGLTAALSAATVTLVIPASGSILVTVGVGFAASWALNGILNLLFRGIEDNFGAFLTTRRFDFGTESTGIFFDGSDRAEKVFGSLYDDILAGAGKSDLIHGGGGDDMILGGSGRDFLRGDSGHDTIYGGSGRDDLWGGSGNDLLDGGAGRERLFGGAGDDKLVLRSTNSILNGGAGLDWLLPAIENVDLQRLSNSATVFNVENIDLDAQEITGTLPRNALGNSADNIMIGNSRNNALAGRGGSDTLEGGFGNDTLDGGAGDDQLIGTDGNNLIFGGRDDDVIFGGVTDKLFGGEGNDIIYGDFLPVGQTHGNDSIDSGSGDDWVQAGGGDDTVLGGDGQDTLLGAFGNDTFIIEHRLRDEVYGGDGNDTIQIMKGYDHYVDGGAGWDIVDLRGLDLSRLNPANFVGIEEIWTDDVLMTSNQLGLQRVRLFGSHIVEMGTEDLGDASDNLSDMVYVFGGASIDLAEGASLRIIYSGTPLGSASPSDYDFSDHLRIIHGNEGPPGTAPSYELVSGNVDGHPAQFELREYERRHYTDGSSSGTYFSVLSDKSFDIRGWLRVHEFSAASASLSLSAYDGRMGTFWFRQQESTGAHTPGPFPIAPALFDPDSLPMTTDYRALVGLLFGKDGDLPTLQTYGNALEWELVYV